MDLAPSGSACDAGTGRFFSISSGLPFLKELAAALVEGRLIEGFHPAQDPMALPQATIYLPTRRAARALTGEIIEALGGRAALLPRIRTLGDSDEEEVALALSATDMAGLSPACSGLERQLQLAAMIRGWTSALSRATRELFGDEDIVIPSSAADALKLASDLARLIDQMETEEIAWTALDGLAGAEHAQWWDLTLTFLRIVTERWPQYLRETNRVDPAAARRDLLDLRARRIAENMVQGPIIAAGSTGSIPATARLLGAIARHEQGAIVLPGVDFDLPESVWRQLSRPASKDEALVLSTHPQYGLARLLDALGVARGSIKPLGGIGTALRPRLGALSIALLPAAETGRWPEAAASASRHPPLHAGLAVIEAPGEREEALAIAIALREALQIPGRTAALTTPDRALARRVAAELGRFDIQVDDSAGVPLNESAAGRFVHLLLSAATQKGNPVHLTAFLKALTQIQTPAGETARGARLFELAILRGALTVPAPGDLEAAIYAAKARSKSDRFVPDIINGLADEDWEALAGLARHVDRSCQPVMALASEDGVALADAMPAIREAIGAALRDADGTLFAEMAGGRETARLFDSFEALAPDDAASRIMRVPYDELPAIFQALAGDITVRDIRHPHPRLHIWGPLEARLQHVDLMIVGGLNEGKWPAAARNDPFLNRPMKGEIGLSFPERQIGQSAHDFQQLSGAGQVVFTRSLRADNAPTVASRWLQRFLTVAGQENRRRLREKGNRYLHLAEALDRSETAPRRASRPCPRPPVAYRPKSLTVTEIETWIRDPYAIHARHVLGLRPLPPLEREAEPALRGMIYHETLARFVEERPEREENIAAGERLAEIARAAFARYKVPPDVAALWLPRLIEVGRMFIDWEGQRRETIEQSLCEVSGAAEIEGFVLRGRADRIDILRDGTAAIFDYKTGLTPSAKQARIFSPQLSLEGWMAQAGAFGGAAAKPVNDLAFVRLRTGEQLRVDQVATEREGESAAELIGQARDRLAGLVAAYRKREQGYLSRYAVMREGEVGGDYDHLARVREWSVGEGPGEDGDG